MTINLPPHYITVMCGHCKGLGTLGGSLYIVESCRRCEGTGRVRMNEITMEWLRKAIKIRDYYYSTWSKKRSDDYANEFIRCYGDLLLQQAERVQELEKYALKLESENDDCLDDIKTMIDKNGSLHKDNKRLREALKYYADKKNYDRMPKSIYTTIEVDGGYEARNALEGEE